MKQTHYTYKLPKFNKSYQKLSSGLSLTLIAVAVKFSSIAASQPQ
jgi:hypothetical protein